MWGVLYTAMVDLDLGGTSSSDLHAKEAPQSLLAEASQAHDKETAPVLDLPLAAHLKHSSAGGECVGELN